MSKKLGKRSSRALKLSRRAAATRCQGASSDIDLADALEKRCTQAIGLANLLMEADAEDAVADTAWLMRDLVEEIRGIGRTLQQIKAE